MKRHSKWIVAFAAMSFSFVACTDSGRHVTARSPSTSISPSPTPASPTPAARTSPTPSPLPAPTRSIPPGLKLVLEKGLGTTSPAGPRRYYVVSGRTFTPYLGSSDGESIPNTRRPTLDPSPDGRHVLLMYSNRLETAPASSLWAARRIAWIPTGWFWTGSAWSLEGAAIAYSIGKFNDPQRLSEGGRYEFWTVGRDGAGRTRVATVDFQMPVHAVAFDRGGGRIYANSGTESGQTGYFRRIDIATGRVAKIAGMQTIVYRRGLAFAADFRSAFWADERGVYRFSLITGTRKLMWRPDPSQTISGLNVMPDRSRGVVSAFAQGDRALRTYLVDLRSGSGSPLLAPSRYGGLEPRAWSPDSRYLWLEPRCDYGCGPDLGNTGEYYLYDAVAKRLTLVFKARRFDAAGDPIDWLRFVAWLRSS